MICSLLTLHSSGQAAECRKLGISRHHQHPENLAMALQNFTSLSGVPVHYDRYSVESGFGYGTRGKPFKPRATAKMVKTLERCFTEIFQESPFGPAETITSAGAYVSKPGQHGKGQAFDLDGIFWGERELIAIEYPKKPHLYLAVESIIRRHFGTVLNYNYNLAHRDHFHLDLGSSVKFERMSKSRVEYLQASMFYVHGFQVGIDGVWGPETLEVSTAVLKTLGFSGGLSNTGTWLLYLKETAKMGFDLADA